MQSKHIRNRKLALEKTNEKDSTREHKHVRAYAQMGPRKEAALRQASELVHASEKRNKKKKNLAFCRPLSGALPPPKKQPQTAVAPVAH